MNRIHSALGWGIYNSNRIHVTLWDILVGNRTLLEACLALFIHMITIHTLSCIHKYKIKNNFLFEVQIEFLQFMQTSLKDGLHQNYVLFYHNIFGIFGLSQIGHEVDMIGKNSIPNQQ